MGTPTAAKPVSPTIDSAGEKIPTTIRRRGMTPNTGDHRAPDDPRPPGVPRPALLELAQEGAALALQVRRDVSPAPDLARVPVEKRAELPGWMVRREPLERFVRVHPEDRDVAPDQERLPRCG